MAKLTKDNAILPVDDLNEAQFQQLYTETLSEIAVLKGRWRGLVALSEKSRRNHPGKNLGPLVPAFKSLFTAMLPNVHDDKATAETRATFAAAFNVHGEKDGGKDPERFEADLLLRRIDRTAAQESVAEELKEFGRLLADDVLHTSEMVLIAGQNALSTARTMGDDHPKYGSFVTAAFDATRKLTKAALARAAELHAERTAAKQAGAAAAATTTTAAKAP